VELPYQVGGEGREGGKAKRLGGGGVDHSKKGARSVRLERIFKGSQ